MKPHEHALLIEQALAKDTDAREELSDGICFMKDSIGGICMRLCAKDVPLKHRGFRFVYDILYYKKTADILSLAVIGALGKLLQTDEGTDDWRLARDWMLSILASGNSQERAKILDRGLQKAHELQKATQSDQIQQAHHQCRVQTPDLV